MTLVSSVGIASMLVPDDRDAEKEHAEQTGEDRQRARGVA